MTSVVIVDDHSLFRAGVRSELDGLVEVLGDAATVEEAVECVVRLEPDVVLLDVHMPGGGGLEVLRDAVVTIGSDGQPPRTTMLAVSPKP